MVQRIKVGKRLLLAQAAGVVLLGAFAVTGNISALGETHSNCILFDSSGNIVGFTPSCSQTMHVTSVPQVMPETPNPCSATGALGTLALNDDHSTAHVNVNASGGAWLTQTDGGSATFTPDNSSDASGAGSWTSWGGLQLNNQSKVNGFTSAVRLSMADGTHVTVHEVQHETITPNGITANFFSVTPSCS